MCVAYACECSSKVAMVNLTSTRQEVGSIKADYFRIWAVYFQSSDGSKLTCEELEQEGGAVFSARPDVNSIDTGSCERRSSRGEVSRTQAHISSNSLVYIEFYDDEGSCKEGLGRKYVGCTAVGAVEDGDKVNIELAP